MDLFYGTELVFKTLRVGFPSARVIVVDNASLPEAAARIELLARENGCAFERVPEPGIKHHEFIEQRIALTAADETAEGPLIFLDPDVCFWRSCEHFDFPGSLMAGRHVRAYHLNATQALTMPRLHTSFLWMPDPRRLWNEITEIRKLHFDFEPFLSYSTKIAGQWCRFDTGASLYAVMPEKMSCFREEHLNCYDHLFCGSHVDYIYSLHEAEQRRALWKIHADAREGNLEALRGIWKWQEEVFGGRRGTASPTHRKEASCIRAKMTVG